MYKKSVILLIAIVLAFVLSACSYKKLEDSAKEKAESLKDKVKESVDINTTMESPAEENKVDENALGIGDTIVYKGPLDFTAEYTLDAVRTGKTLEEVGLNRNEFSTPEKIAEDGTPTMDAVNGFEGEEAIFVVATVTVKNVDWDANKFPLMIETVAGIEEAFDENSLTSTQEAQYFSAHSQDKKDYSKFALEPGNELQIEVGWIVPKIYQDKPYYYEIGSMSRSIGGAQYFQMDISGESDK